MNKTIMCCLAAVLAALCVGVGYKLYRDKPAPGPLVPELVVKKDTIKPGQTLVSLFSEYDIAPKDKQEIVNSFLKVYGKRIIKGMTEYEVTVTTGGQFRKFSYSPAPNEEYVVSFSTFGPERYTAQALTQPLEKNVLVVTGTVTSSLYAGMTGAGLRPATVMDFAEIFESVIDFFTEPVPGDSFRVKVEVYMLDGKIIRSGRILSAEYEGKNCRENAVWYEYKPGFGDYFSASGASLKRAFLRAPLSYRRISSHFTTGRFHPILKRLRPHLGIDYAAPKGTPVSTIGDGVVTFAGWNGGFGKLVKVRHFNGYESWYGHLSGYGRNIRPGRKVLMGGVIGYVGSTGLSTGPHLDFRLRNGKRFMNFLTIKLPFQKTIPAGRMAGFKQYARAELAMLRGDNSRLAAK